MAAKSKAKKKPAKKPSAAAKAAKPAARSAKAPKGAGPDESSAALRASAKSFAFRSMR